MNIHSVRITFACYVYMYIGIFLFFLGWVKFFWAVPALALLAFSLWKHWKTLRSSHGMDKLFVHPAMLVAAGLFCLALCTLAGQGAFFAQTGDWEKHNMVLNDLVAYHWPVCYQNDDGKAMLTYYIAQYLFPALCGKLALSFRVAEISLLLYNAVGIFGVSVLLFRVVKADTVKKQVVSLVVFAFFGSCLFLGKALYGATGIGASDVSELRDWISNSMQLQYRTLFVGLRWAFPQAIVPWMAALLFAENYRNVRLYCLIGAPLLLHATFPFLGLAFMMTGVVAYQAFAQTDRKALLKDIFCVENVATAVGFLILLVYILGNVFQEKVEEVGFSYVNYGRNATVYFCFAVTFLAYSAVIFKKYKDNLLFYLINVSLLILPFFRMGIFNDWIMSVSIPALFLLMTLVLQALFAYCGSLRGRKHAIALIFLLVVGAVYPMEEMADACREPISFQGAAPGSLNEWAHRDGTVGVAEAYNYFTYDYEDSLFWRFFSKHPD